MFSMRYLKIWVGGAILLVLCICGVAAPLLAPRDPQAVADWLAAGGTGGRGEGQ